MTRTPRLGLLAALMVAQPVLMAQEPWDTSFKLVAAQVSGQEKAGLGQDLQYGLTIAGAHPLTPRGTLCLEGGYMYSPTSTRSTSITNYEDRRDIYHLGAHYRQGLFVDGFAVQGGLRYTSAVVTTRTYVNASTWVQDHGPRHGAVSPFIGLHGRLTEKLSVELNGSRLAVKNLNGQVTKERQVEVALGIHLGK